MRVASRVIGVVLALTGLGFLALPAYVYALGQGSPDAVSWIVIAVGVGCLLAARYFLKLDVDALADTGDRPASRFALYFIAHRRELRLIALPSSPTAPASRLRNRLLPSGSEKSPIPLASHQWLHLPVPSRIVQDGLLVLLFAWEVLFFQYGALRAVATPGNILKS